MLPRSHAGVADRSHAQTCRMIFRQLQDPNTATFTYLLACPESRQAVLIDPVLEQHERDVALLTELGLTLILTLDTHLHADHITGAHTLRERLRCQVYISARAGAENADVELADGDLIEVGQIRLQARSTPGHTSGCMTFVAIDQHMAFTGDTLLIGGCGRTDFQGGCAATLYRSVHEQIFSLPDTTRLLPGHDYRGRTETTVGAEKNTNGRLGNDRPLTEFIEIMDNLGLSYPKRIDVALPANRRCGQC